MSPARRAAAFPLDSLPVKPLDAVFVRCVPQLSFDSGRPPSYFFVSGHARRLNPRGVECLYFGSDEATAGAEYDRNAAGTTAGNQPKIIFKVRAHLHGVIDLGDAYVRKRLKIHDIDLFGPWRGKRETRLQALGRAVSTQLHIAAVRFPSDAARARGQEGWNLAVFIASMTGDDRLEILGPTNKPLEVFTASPHGRKR